jgi:hypothetical protein
MNKITLNLAEIPVILNGWIEPDEEDAFLVNTLD